MRLLGMLWALFLMIGGAANLIFRGFGWWPLACTLFGTLIVGGSIFFHFFPEIGKRPIIKRTRPLPHWIGAVLDLFMYGMIAYMAYLAWQAYRDGNSPDVIFYGWIVCYFLWRHLKEWFKKAPGASPPPVR